MMALLFPKLLPFSVGVKIVVTNLVTLIDRKAYSKYDWDRMMIVARKTLKDFWTTHPDAEGPLTAWYREILHATWKTPAELKAQYRNASILTDKLVIFNIAGNKYRLAVRVFFESQTVYIRFVGTHAEYDQMDPKGL